MKVFWGTLSQVKCELRLLKKASGGKYHYYHLLSGMDFPLKSQDYIHKYFSSESGEFISCDRYFEPPYPFMVKVQFYYPFLKFVGKSTPKGRGIRDKIKRKFGYWQQRLLEIQRDVGIDRTKVHKNIVFYKGDNWFSITHDLVEYLLAHQSKIYSLFFWTNGPDELFIQTLAMGSFFSDRVRFNSLREIDWGRGEPYEYTINDLELLIKSDALFVRKISYERNPELVEALKLYLHA